MENKKIDLPADETGSKILKKNNPYTLQIIAMIAIVIVLVIMFYGSQNSTDKTSNVNVETQNVHISEFEEYVLPSNGVVLPVSWGNLGTELVSVGVVDADKFKAIYEGRGAFTDEYKKLLLGKNEGKLKITKENAGYLLNLFWA